MMKGLLLFVACLKLSSGSYSYNPRNIQIWGDVNPDCYGQRQSPIKLDPSTKNDPNLKDVKYSDDYESSGTFDVKYPRDHFFGEVNFGSGDGNQIIAEFSGDGPTIEGSFFGSDSYRLKFIRCAVAGDGQKEGSEHKIGYQSYVGECQFYHVNTRTEDATHPLAEDGANAWAVLAFFLKAKKAGDGGHDYEWDKLIEAMVEFDGSASGDIDASPKSVELTPSKLIPKHATDFYFYQGSITHPPCYENVNWHIFTKPIEISDNQLMDLQMLMNANTRATTTDLFPNSRPVQDLNLRKVIGHIKKKSHSSSSKSSSSRRRHSRRHSRRPHRRPSPHKRRPSRRPPHPYGPRRRPHRGPSRSRYGYSGHERH